MRFREIKPDTSFYGVASALLSDLRSRNSSDTYYLFSREEAKKIYFILNCVWVGAKHMNVSYFYKGEETVAFAIKGVDHTRNNPLRPIECHKESLGSLFSEKVEITEGDRAFFIDEFNLKPNNQSIK
jgi:hypothetical protein